MTTFLLLIAAFCVGLWGIGDAVTKPDIAWREIGKDKVVWVLIQVFLGIIGTILYMSLVRPSLVRAVEYHQSQHD